MRRIMGTTLGTRISRACGRRARGRGRRGQTRLLLVAAVALVAVLAAGVVSGAGAEWDVYPGESIQDAIDGADPGDTIYVHAGEYCENVDVNKRLTMIGASADVVTVTATDARDHVFEVTADYVNISGFTVTGATGYTYAGIYLSRADHCKIYKNAASGNHWGTYLKDSSNNTLASNTASNNRGGIGLIEDCSNNTLTCNNASWNDNSGIWLYVSSDNTLTDNTANSNDGAGIRLYDSSNNTLTNNTMLENRYNFGVYGSSLSEYIQDIDASNMVDEKPIYYWVDQRDEAIPDDAGFVGIVNGANVTVRDLALLNNGCGVLFAYTKNSRIENVTASRNSDSGIYLAVSSNNTLTGNNASWNDYIGIHLSGSSDNTLTCNTASGNNDLGIYLGSSNNNILTGNNASWNDEGICIDDSSENTLTGNIVNSNDGAGIGMYVSSNNTLKENTARSNTCGATLGDSSNNTFTENTFVNDGLLIWDSYRNSIENNTVNGKPLVYLEDATNYTITSAGQVILVNCNNITAENLDLSNIALGIWILGTDNSVIANNTISSSVVGICLYDSSENTLTGNTVSSNGGGICLSGSSNNTLTGNNASWNSEDGIYIGSSSNNTLTGNNASWNSNSGIRLRYSSDNRIHHNNWINNAGHNAYDSDGTNQWDSGSEGNYWSDYTGADNDTDGIGDTHHPIPGGGGSIDRFPLMHPWAGYMPQKGNLNHDNRITSADAAIALHLAATGAHDPVADVSGDDRVTSLDALMILQAAAGRIEL